MKVGDRVRVKEPWSREFNAEGTILSIDHSYCPPCVVLLDKYAEKVPEMAVRFFYENSLEKI